MQIYYQFWNKRAGRTNLFVEFKLFTGSASEFRFFRYVRISKVRFICLKIRNVFFCFLQKKNRKFSLSHFMLNDYLFWSKANGIRFLTKRTDFFINFMAVLVRNLKDRQLLLFFISPIWSGGNYFWNFLGEDKFDFISLCFTK